MMTDVSKDPAGQATLQNVRRLLGEVFRGRRDDRVYHVLRQIGTLPAQWLLHRLADELPDDTENRNRKRMAAETAATLDQVAVS